MNNLALSSWLILAQVGADTPPSLAVACTSKMGLEPALARIGEEPIARGVASNGQLLEIWSSAGGDTWTATLSSGGGITCILAIGKALETRQHSRQEKPS